MAKTSRKRMVMSAASLIGSRGANATSFSDVLKESGAPRGSIYHYFPAGKRQLVGDALRWTTEQVLDHQRACTATTASGVLQHFVSLFRASVVSSGCRAGCPVAGVVVDTYGGDDRMIKVVGASFESWITLLTDQLLDVGVPRGRARALAVTALASMEGALILCRADASVAPLDSVAQQLERLTSSRSSGRGPKTPRRQVSRPGSRPSRSRELHSRKFA